MTIILRRNELRDRDTALTKTEKEKKIQAKSNSKSCGKGYCGRLILWRNGRKALDRIIRALDPRGK